MVSLSQSTTPANGPVKEYWTLSVNINTYLVALWCFCYVRDYYQIRIFRYGL